MNKLEKINELVERIKLYGSGISDIYENIDKLSSAKQKEKFR